MFDFIWSDQHFGHKNILKYTERDYANIDDMNDHLLVAYEDAICTLDRRAVVVWAGDVFVSAVEDFHPWMDDILTMGAYNILVRGNHDASTKKMCDIGFDCVVDEMVGVVAGRRVRISHYPYKKTKDVAGGLRYQKRSPDRVKGEVLLHGHTHSPERVRGNMINIGVDAWDMEPVSMAEIEHIVEKI